MFGRSRVSAAFDRSMANTIIFQSVAQRTSGEKKTTLFKDLSGRYMIVCCGRPWYDTQECGKCGECGPTLAEITEQKRLRKKYEIEERRRMREIQKDLLGYFKKEYGAKKMFTKEAFTTIFETWDAQYVKYRDEEDTRVLF